MQDLIQRLTSRKFLLALASGLAAYERGETILAGVIAAIYVIAEAQVDARRQPPAE